MTSLISNKKPSLLIVGSFPKKPIFGGIQKSCELIINSHFFSNIKLIQFDSSQISNPPPTFIIRFFLAFIRLIRFVFKIFTHKPKVTLIFCSDGLSALEKGIMVWLSKIFGAKPLIFPRAGNLINQVEKYPFFKRIIKFLFSKAIFLAQGENWKLFALQKLDISTKRIKILHNWTATEEFLSIGESRKNESQHDVVNFLFVGWLEKEKGVLEILNSIKILKDKNHSLFFTFIGNGKLMKTAKDYIAKNKLKDFVTFEGWKPNNQLNEHYKSADVFVLPSWAEGMPNALIEALSCGLASITTNVGMIPNYLKDNHNALLINPKSTEELSTAMEKLTIDKNLKLKLSKNAYKLAIKYFSTEKGLMSLSELIKNEITNE